jgi:predicted RNase H-like nuclease (RuvC/YqgF family)
MSEEKPKKEDKFAETRRMLAEREAKKTQQQPTLPLKPPPAKAKAGKQRQTWQEKSELIKLQENNYELIQQVKHLEREQTGLIRALHREQIEKGKYQEHLEKRKEEADADILRLREQLKNIIAPINNEARALQVRKRRLESRERNADKWITLAIMFAIGAGLLMIYLLYSEQMRPGLFLIFGFIITLLFGTLIGSWRNSVKADKEIEELKTNLEIINQQF